MRIVPSRCIRTLLDLMSWCTRPTCPRVCEICIILYSHCKLNHLLVYASIISFILALYRIYDLMSWCTRPTCSRACECHIVLYKQVLHRCNTCLHLYYIVFILYHIVLSKQVLHRIALHGGPCLHQGPRARACAICFVSDLYCKPNRLYSFFILLYYSFFISHLVDRARLRSCVRVWHIMLYRVRHCINTI